MFFIRVKIILLLHHKIALLFLIFGSSPISISNSKVEVALLIASIF